MEYINKYFSLVGEMVLISDGENLTGLYFNDINNYISTNKYIVKNLPIFNKSKKWLDIYFSGYEPNFTIPIKFNENASAFRKKVWEILKTIPYGKSITYGYIANLVALDMGISKMSAQAVGGAVGANPISIIVPCHRVLGKNNTLTGYAGGILKKEQLLKIEKIEYKK